MRSNGKVEKSEMRSGRGQRPPKYSTVGIWVQCKFLKGILIDGLRRSMRTHVPFGLLLELSKNW